MSLHWGGRGPGHLSRMSGPGYGWRTPGSFMDADFANGRFYWNQLGFASEAAFLTAIGGSKASNAYLFGPYENPTELFTNGTFASDVSGWTATGTGAAIAWAAGECQLTMGGAGTTSKFSQSVAAALGHAYRMRGSGRRGTTTTSLQLAMSTADTFTSNTSLSSGSINSTSNTDLSADFVPIVSNPAYFGIRNNATSGAGTALLDNLSLKELTPFAGFPANGFTVAIDATAPAGAVADEVLFQLDNNTDTIRVRLIRQVSDDHLIYDVRNGATVTVFKDMGAVADGAAFSVAISATQASFTGALNGVPITPVSTGILWGTPYMRIGTAQAGSAWSGTIQRVTIL